MRASPKKVKRRSSAKLERSRIFSFFYDKTWSLRSLGWCCPAQQSIKRNQSEKVLYEKNRGFGRPSGKGVPWNRCESLTTRQEWASGQGRILRAGLSKVNRLWWNPSSVKKAVCLACHSGVLCEGVGLVHRATFCKVSSDIVVDVFSSTITEKKILIGWNCWGAS